MLQDWRVNGSTLNDIGIITLKKYTRHLEMSGGIMGRQLTEAVLGVRLQALSFTFYLFINPSDHKVYKAI